MSAYNGGPAFPHEYKFGDGTAARADGMTLRDYFAAKYLEGYMANPDVGFDTRAEAAAQAYAMADAMLKAREA